MLFNTAVPHQIKMRIIPDIRNLIFGKGKEVYYIGGAEILPPPLEGIEEKEMIRCLGTEHDEEAKKTLIEHNLRLVVYIAKKFDNTGVGVEDLISIGTIGLIKAINTFNPTKKIKLATYASRCIENEILMYLRRNSKTKMAERKLLVRALNKLSSREKLIVKMRFGLDNPEGREKTQKEVADLLGISQSYISRLEKKIMQRLKREMVRYE